MNLLRVGLVVGLAILCAGCPSILKPEAMQASIAPPLHRSAGDLLVVVMGATKLSKTKPVQVTDDGFAQALAASIEQSGIFRRVLRDASGHYRLDATVQGLEEDIFGLDMTASMEVSYVLARMSPKGIVWEKKIRTSHTAGMNDSVISITRVRLATEGASRRNIEQALQDISVLKLD
ncbi:MAG: hypothetical protein K2Q17_05830 [Nitrospiraceae bacterium]|uniref:hypothetical protein n=1 Tax=Nitrospira cf. moscoviensis SBR1015 TaxID=96242 RepID=UPI001121745B|nr:hypothetical protein [Nitrospira cf. moscoviensis SBR1015]MBY0247169.1 hypothetical protein [Nitrospiraceae bacterium]